METVRNLRAALQAGESSEALTRQALQAIGRRNGELNAFVRVYAEEALDAARASDEIRRAGGPRGPLDGIPIAIKDNLSWRGHITSAGSHMLENYRAPYDATVVAQLVAGGAVIVGQTNMDEFAMGSSTETSAFGPTKNPHDVRRVPGGSSGGAAAAVAAGMVPLAYGSDTGGSIRQPAALCGTVGLKPTYGAVSRYGLLAMASSLDTIGPLARTVDDVAVGFQAVNQFDTHDSTSVAAELRREPAVPDRFVFGLPKQFLTEGLDERIRISLLRLAERLERAGHTVREIDLPTLDRAVAIYYLIVPAEVSSNLARYDGVRYGLHGDGVIDTRTRGFGPEAKRRIILGTFALSAGYADAYYKKAQLARRELAIDLMAAFGDVDLLLGPVSPVLAPKLGERQDDPLSMYLLDIYTVPVNLAGVPGLTIPYGTIAEDGVNLPVAAQLIGPHWSEQALFAAGRIIEGLKE